MSEKIHGSMTGLLPNGLVDVTLLENLQLAD